MTLAHDRRRRTIAALEQGGLESLVAYGNAWQNDYFSYVSDFNILEGGGIALLGRDGTARVYLDSLVEVERASEEVDGAEIVFARDLAGTVARDLAQRTGRTGAAPRPFFPHALIEAAGARLEDATALVDRLLMHKLPEEIETIRRAAHLADDGYAIFRAAAREGRAQYELVADVEAFLRSCGAADNFMLVGSGGVEVRAMEPPSDRRLARGDLVTTELTPALDGYYAQICRTLVVGEAANDAQRRAFGVYREALEAGIAAVKPGARAADVARAENDVFRKYGLGDYVTSRYTRVRGHGLGLFPDSKPHILEDVETVLEPGMTVVVHPNTYHPDVGYIVLGDSVVVTENGADVLTRTARTLFDGAA